MIAVSKSEHRADFFTFPIEMKYENVKYRNVAKIPKLFQVFESILLKTNNYL